MKPSILSILALAAAGHAAADTLCFESDKQDVSARTAWSHTWYVVEAGPVLTGPDGKVFRALSGYGYNDAPAVSGGGDTVPFVGSAVRDVDQMWKVSILGTLTQTSVDRREFTTQSIDLGPTPAYWIISQNWIFEAPGVARGIAHIGNLIKPFNGYLTMHDDGFKSDIWRISCDQIGGAQ